jgi:hypothetical protein
LETAKKMVEIGAEHVSVGPVEAWDFDFRDREFFYMPSKGEFLTPDHFKSGFVVSFRERSLDVSYVEYFIGPPEDFIFQSGWGINIINEDLNSKNFHAETVKRTGLAAPLNPPALLNLVRFNADDYGNNEFRVIQYPPGGWEVDPSLIDPAGNLPNLRDHIFQQWFVGFPEKVPTIVGTSITATAGPDDLQVFFCRFEGSGAFAELLYPTTTNLGIDVGGAILYRDDLDFNFPDEVENGFYHYVWTTDQSFFSYYSKTQRKYKNYRWGPGALGYLTPLVDMDRRIDAALSNGNLLSFENNRCYVYDSDGDKLYSFLLGGLHFCYETYFGGVPHVVFSLGAWLDFNDQRELFFTVYAIPTDRLEELQ